jgi:hypothetical protein
LGSSLKITEIAQIFGIHLCTENKLLKHFNEKWFSATSWATFSQTHPVTLLLLALSPGHFNIHQVVLLPPRQLSMKIFSFGRKKVETKLGKQKMGRGEKAVKLSTG